MLELRPNCEYCDKNLPPDSTDALMCSYECTFCSACVGSVLNNVCPNCGGGFTPRPVRPTTERRQGLSLVHQPASTLRVHLSYEKEDIAKFVAVVKDIPSEQR
ncbi:MAG: DUF1272 domain-containing protein [Gammaproteobacteria bacterium]|nr:DUF1272 domain-containing protein [Gammaproteobacteria bacterium]